MPEITDLAGAQQAVENGRRLSFFFFWGHRAEEGSEGRPGPWCLSQWWPAPFEYDGDLFPTAEHFMMWKKARLFGDSAVAAAILKTNDAGEAKELGRKVRGFNEPPWIRHRDGVVRAGNLAKFAQHATLGDYLLSIGADVIAEASPVDAIWGIGVRSTDPRARDPRRWPGLNLLGFGLMWVRKTRRESSLRSVAQDSQR